MTPIDVVTDARDEARGGGDAEAPSLDAALAPGEGVDPVPIGDPDEDEGYDDEEDEDGEDDDEEPLQCAGDGAFPALPRRVRREAGVRPGVSGGRSFRRAQDHFILEASLIVFPATMKRPRPR